MGFDCLACGNGTKEKYSNSRVMHYICEDYDLLFVVHSMPVFHPGKSEKIMMLSADGKRFILRDSEDYFEYGIPVL